MNTDKRKIIKAAADWIYFVALAAYLIKAGLLTTMFDFAWPDIWNNAIRIILVVVIVLKLCGVRPLDKKKIILAAIAAACFAAAALLQDHGILLDIILLVIAAYETDYKKVLTVCFWCAVGVTTAAFIASLAGGIPDLVYVQEGGQRIRHSFGSIYPTDFTAHILFIMLTGYVLYCRVLFIVLSAAFVPILYIFCNARNNCLMLALLAAGGIIHIFVYEKDSTKARETAKKVINAIITWLMPVLSALMIILSLAYDKHIPILKALNKVLNHRLSLGSQIASDQGIHLFGAAFEMRGNGGTLTEQSSYYFLDSSYVQILILYGIVILLIFNIAYVLLAKRIIKTGADSRILIALAVIACACAVEHHLADPSYNAFLLLPLAALGEGAVQSCTKGQKSVQ